MRIFSVFTVAFEDFDPDTWEEDVTKPIVEPLRDKIVYDAGELI